MTNTDLTYILLDTSYFIFYRYYALISWWKLAQPDIEIGIPIENEVFVEKFKKTIVEFSSIINDKNPKESIYLSIILDLYT